MLINIRKSIFQQIWLYFLAIIVNIALSYIVLLHREPLNIDGILYLHTAEVYLHQGFQAALQVYPWPFYAVMIAKIAQITDCSLLSSAYLINAILTSLLVCAFLRVIRIAGGTLSHQYWGMLILLLYPFLNHDRYNILRDFGYYAFFMVSVGYFIKFLRDYKIYDSLGWQLCLLLAAIFRLEGLALLYILPVFTILVEYQKSVYERGKIFLALTSLSLCALPVALPLLYHDGHWTKVITNLDFAHTFSLLNQKVFFIKTQILGELAKNEATWFMTGGIMAIFLAEILSIIGILPVIFLLYGAYRKYLFLIINEATKKSFLLYGFSISLILIVFLTRQLFLSERYIFPLALLFAVILAFLLKKLYDLPYKTAKASVIFLLLFHAIASFGHFGPSNTYIRDAGEWIAQHTPPNSVLFTNNPQVAYYAQKTSLSPLSFICFRHYAYAVIILKHHEQNTHEKLFIQLIDQPPVKIFENTHHDKALIYAKKI